MVRLQPRSKTVLAWSLWLVSFGCLTFDILSWILIYGVISYVRRDQFLVGPLEFVLVDVIQLTFICQALFMIGGYDRNTDTRTLTYAAEHILAIAGAAGQAIEIVHLFQLEHYEPAELARIVRRSARTCWWDRSARSLGRCDARVAGGGRRRT